MEQNSPQRGADDADQHKISTLDHAAIELAQMHELLEQTGQLAQVGTWEIDLATNIQRWSPVTRAIYEAPDDLLPALYPDADFCKNAGDKAGLSAAMTKAIETGAPFDVELQIVTHRGHERWIRVLGRAEFSDGRGQRLFGAVQDITGRKLAEEARSESEERFRQIAENVGEVFWLRSADNAQMLYVNPAYERVWGRSRQSLYADPQSYMDTIHDEDKQAVLAAYAAYSKTGIFDITFRIVRPDGTIRWLQAKSTPVKNAAGEAISHTGVAVDITDRKQIEEELLLQTRLQDMLMEISSTYISLPVDRVDATIRTSLGSLGEFVGADRVYLFDYDFEQGVCNNTHEWCGSEIAPQIDNLQEIPLAMVPDWLQTHLQGETMYVPDVAALPVESGLREILEPQAIQSLLAVPMMDGARCLGFVGFDWVRRLHRYSDAEQRLLTVFAQMLANVRKRRELEEEMQRLAAEAQAASRAKSDFLAMMSHEIRTPLNGIIGFTDLLLKTPLNATQEQYAQLANSAGQTLVAIINDILDLSKIEAGKLELDIVEADIVELAEQAADIIKYHMAQKGLEFLLNLPLAMPRRVHIDPIRLKQILINLLSNAVKFTERGEIELSVEYAPLDAAHGRYTFTVRDTGIGITPQQRERLFKAFSQADTSTTRRYGGTGLGLTISNLLAAKMGSQIEVESEEGLGSQFHFTVDIAYGDAAPEAPSAGLPIKRALLLDDNVRSRQILERMLMHWGIAVSSGDSAAAGLHLLATSPPFDALIIDYHMPEHDGLTTIKLLRNALPPAAPWPKAILLHSSAEDQALRNNCQKLGVRCSLVKPVKADELYNLLHNIAADDDAPHVPPAPALPAPAAEDARSAATILVAEDVAMNMLLVKTLLSRLRPKATVFSARTGAEAVQMVTDHEFDLVLMDVHMPELDGLAATQQIRAYEQDAHTHVPIIALTAGALNEERERCLASGMDDFLTKPIHASALAAILDQYLKDTVDA